METAEEAKPVAPAALAPEEVEPMAKEAADTRKSQNNPRVYTDDFKRRVAQAVAEGLAKGKTLVEVCAKFGLTRGQSAGAYAWMKQFGFEPPTRETSKAATDQRNARLVAKFRISGLTLRAFAREEGIGYGVLQYALDTAARSVKPSPAKPARRGRTPGKPDPTPEFRRMVATEYLNRGQETPDAFAARHGVPASTIQMWAMKLRETRGLPVRRAPTEARKADVLAAFATRTVSLKDFCAQQRITASTLVRWRKEEGMPALPKGGAAGNLLRAKAAGQPEAAMVRAPVPPVRQAPRSKGSSDLDNMAPEMMRAEITVLRAMVALARLHGFMPLFDDILGGGNRR